jgi:D-alanine-D-alanine ligase
MDDMRSVIDGIVAESSECTPVVFNLCDGDETNGVPGISVVRCLHERGICYTGADADFYDVTTSKIGMKRVFDEAGVPTSPWAVMDGRATDGIFDRCGTPLIVKPAISAGSMGITVDSVVHTEAALQRQLDLLRDGYRGWDLAGGGVLVERFVSGPEYTTFIVGSCDAPDACIVYPPVERVFNRALPPTEQFLSFDRLWEIYERETPVGDGEYLWEYAPVADALAQRIADVSSQAYAAVGGRGYGRVDLRMEATTGALYVLEVNAQCGLSEDEDYTSIGAILRMARVTFADAVRQIIADAQRTRSARDVALPPVGARAGVA